LTTGCLGRKLIEVIEELQSQPELETTRTPTKRLLGKIKSSKTKILIGMSLALFFVIDLVLAYKIIQKKTGNEIPHISNSPTASQASPTLSWEPTATPAWYLTPTSGPSAPTNRPPAGKGKVFFAFADGFKSCATLAYPVLQAKGWAGVAYISPGVIGTKGNKMTIDDLKVLNQAGWDVASHGYFHDAPTTLDPSQLTDHLKLSHDWLVQNGFINGSRHYGAPTEGCNQTVLQEALKYYQTIQGHDCNILPEGYSYTKISASDEFDWEKVQNAIDKIQTSDQVLQFRFHDVVAEAPGKGDTTVARLTQIADYVAAKGLEVVTLSDLLDSE
jgi:peptidoglycan/xylan/chitin deacetylase (PgdA/CDA1 family)